MWTRQLRRLTVLGGGRAPIGLPYNRQRKRVAGLQSKISLSTKARPPRTPSGWWPLAGTVALCTATVGFSGVYADTKGETSSFAKSDASDNLIDMRQFEYAISNQADFAGLIKFLREEHGIRLRRLLGVGSASVIFVAEVEVGENEYELSTVKIIDHALVRCDFTGPRDYRVTHCHMLLFLYLRRFVG